MEICPKCGFTPVAGEECPRCKVLVSGYRGYLRALGAEAASVGGGAPAGFWVRAAALLLDLGFLLVVEFVVWGVGTFLWGEEVTTSPLLQASITAFHLVFGSAYFLCFHWIWGQTIGKMVLELRVVTVEGVPISLGAALVRYLGWLFSVTVVAGALMAGLRADKRALHDLLAKTRVVRLPSTEGMAWYTPPSSGSPMVHAATPASPSAMPDAGQHDARETVVGRMEQYRQSLVQMREAFRRDADTR